MTDRARIKLFFDGGLRPAGMETAVVLRGHAHVRRDLGNGTSIDAEWLALIAAVRLAREHHLDDVLILGDCIPVIAQANGAAKARGDCAQHLQAYRALLTGNLRARIRYIRRTQNLAGIALARLHER